MSKKCPGTQASSPAEMEVRSLGRTIVNQQGMHGLIGTESLIPQPPGALGDNQPFYFVDDLEANRLPAEQLGWHTFASLDELAPFVE